MKECTQIQELIPLGISNDLAPAEMGHLRSHLDTCLECRKEFETYRAIRGELGKLRIANSELQNVTLQVPDITTKPQRTQSPVLAGWRYASVAAVFLMGIVVGFAGWRLMKTNTPPLPAPQPITQAQPLIGAELRPVSEAMEQHLGLPPCQGMVISNLQKQSPAEQMGFKTGDILVSINGKPVTSTEFTLGKQGEIRIIRNGVTINIKLTRD